MIDIDLHLTLTTAQRNAWQTVRPVVRAYLVKIWRVYRCATPEQRVVLMAHNPVLDAVVDMLGGDD